MKGPSMYPNYKKAAKVIQVVRDGNPGAADGRASSSPFQKNTGKVGIAFCYWINMKGGMWQYFFPTYDHCVGAEKIREILHGIEIDNFDKNFENA